RFMPRILLVLLLVFAGPAHAAAVLVVGDSLSAAYGIAAGEGWVALLDRRLRDAGTGHVVVNASISGETTSGGLLRLPALLASEQPAVVRVGLGATAGPRGLAIAAARDTLAAMLAAIRDAGARAVLVGIELPVNYGPRYREGFRSMYRGLADEFNVPLV